jgi:hypothetical protein
MHFWELKAAYNNSYVTDLQKETNMPILLWLLGVPVVVIVLLMLTHTI